MSDPDVTPDPIDAAYVEAEAVLSDEAARAARRARVLAAVTRQGARDAPAARARLWRRGGWLVAASVSGLALVIASQLYRPPPLPLPSKPAPAATSTTGPTTAPALPAPALALPTKATARGGKSEAAPPPVAVAPSPAPPPVVVALLPAPPPAAPSDAAPPPRAFLGGAAAAPPPPPPGADFVASQQAPARRADQALAGGTGNGTAVTELVVTAEKRETHLESVPVAITAFTSSSRDAVGINPAAVNPGAQLRAAAAAGRTEDMEALLHQGAPVDAPDAAGDTALMISIQADHPAAAALLRRHGASLDRTNHAGESARGMAAERGDAALDQAIGLGP